jgi:hypothetical protein
LDGGVRLGSLKMPVCTCKQVGEQVRQARFDPRNMARFELRLPCKQEAEQGSSVSLWPWIILGASTGLSTEAAGPLINSAEQSGTRPVSG